MLEANCLLIDFGLSTLLYFNKSARIR